MPDKRKPGRSIAARHVTIAADRRAEQREATKLATTTLAAAEAQARRGQATTPDRTETAPAGLTTAAFSVTRGRAADPPEAGDGQTPIPSGALFGPGGNMLRAWALDVPDGKIRRCGSCSPCRDCRAV